MTIAIAGLALIAAARDGAMRTALDTLVGQSKHPLSTCRVGTPGGALLLRCATSSIEKR